MSTIKEQYERIQEGYGISDKGDRHNLPKSGIVVGKAIDRWGHWIHVMWNDGNVDKYTASTLSQRRFRVRPRMLTEKDAQG